MQDKIPFKNRKKQVLFFLMLFFAGLMFFSESSIVVILAAVCTLLYFRYWIVDTAREMQNWSHDMKGYFSIFSDYANKFVDILSKKKEGRG